MRALVTRSGSGSGFGPRSRGLLLPSSVVCAALIFGPVGTAVAVTDATRDAYAYASVGAGSSWSSAYSDRVLNRIGVLERADRTDVLAPVLNVLTDLTEQTGTGRLNAAQAAGFAKAVETANTSLKQRLAERTGTTTRAAAAIAIAMADPISDLLAQLQSTLSGLLDTVTGLVGGLLGTVTGLVGGLLDTLGKLLGGLLGSLPPLPVELPPIALPPLELPAAELPAALPAPVTP